MGKTIEIPRYNNKLHNEPLTVLLFFPNSIT